MFEVVHNFVHKHYKCGVRGVRYGLKEVPGANLISGKAI